MGHAVVLLARVLFCIGTASCASLVQLNPVAGVNFTESLLSAESVLIDAMDSSSAEKDAVHPVACPAESRHSCAQRCDSEPRTKAPCHCDELCPSYADCCRDYATACGVGGGGTRGNATGGTPVPSPADGDEYARCVQTAYPDPGDREEEEEEEDGELREGYRLLAACPPDWTGDPAVPELCQEPAGSDGLAAIPVEGPAGRHFKNVYCALCHGVPVGDVSFWSATYTQTGTATGNAGASSAGQFIRAANGSREFVPPAAAGRPLGSLRSCVPVLPVICPAETAELRADCEGYLDPVVVGGETYRNMACYRCHSSAGQTLSGSTRPCSNRTAEIALLAGSGPSMVTLLVFSDHTDVGGLGTVGSQACTAGQIFDPFLGACRDLLCPPGSALLLEGDLRRCAVPLPGPRAPTAGAEVVLTVVGSLADEGPVRRSWEAIVGEAAGEYASWMFPPGYDGDESTGSPSPDDRGTGPADGGDAVANLTWSCDAGVEAAGTDNACADGRPFACSVAMVVLAVPASAPDLLGDRNGRLLGNCFHGNGSGYSVRTESLAIRTPCDELADSASTSSAEYVWDDMSDQFVLSKNHSCEPVYCPLLTIPRREFALSGALNGTVRLLRHDRVLAEDDYYRFTDEGALQVCNFLEGSEGVAWDVALTVTGSSLSLVGVVVTMATYVTFAQLRRNAAGKSLMGLVTSLSLAQLTMLIGLKKRTDVMALCVAFAIISHYFWLSAFFWMNTLAIDIYRTFGIGTKINDPNTRSVRYYALYGLGAPALIVGVCAFLSFCDCVDLDVHYASEHACWIGGGMTNLVTFGVPVIAVLCCNAVLFSLTVAGVMKTRRASEKMNVTQGQGDAAAKSRTDLILYLKLTVIMGFTWIFGFVASFTGIQFFWYPYIVLNSLQGALVGLAFVCNRRVLGMWRARLGRSGGPPRGSRSQTTSSTLAGESKVTASTTFSNV